MTYIELFLLAIGLCFDTFAVSLTGGICLNVRLKWLQTVKIFSFFALFQAGFAFIGWLLGYSVSTYIEKYDHWIAFLLLLYIGGKMVFEGLSKEKEGEECGKNKINLLDTKQLSLLSIATSIDALAVGISLAMINLDKVKVGVGLTMIFAVTALASLVGLLSGNRLGSRFGKKSELVGGVILIAIGVKILLEHTLG